MAIVECRLCDENERLDGLCRRLLKKPLLLGELAVGVGKGTGIDCSASGIETLRGDGNDETMAGFDRGGEAGVAGANSLASESPSCVRPGGRAGACSEDVSAIDSRTARSSFSPRD